AAEVEHALSGAGRMIGQRNAAVLLGGCYEDVTKAQQLGEDDLVPGGDRLGVRALDCAFHLPLFSTSAKLLLAESASLWIHAQIAAGGDAERLEGERLRVFDDEPPPARVAPCLRAPLRGDLEQVVDEGLLPAAFARERQAERKSPTGIWMRSTAASPSFAS